MFKRFLTLFLVGLFMFPMAVQAWGTHDFKHTMHAVSESHHAVVGDHQHAEHSHGEDVVETQQVHHPIFIGLSSYFKDYLHVDVPNSRVSIVKIALRSVDQYDVDADALASPAWYNVADSPTRENIFVISYRELSQSDTYLKTQRLRI